MTDVTSTGTSTLGQSGIGSNGNEVVFHTCKVSKTGASSPDAV